MTTPDPSSPAQSARAAVKAGRRRPAADDLQTETLKCRCTQTELASVSQQAKQANQKPSDWIRHRLFTKPEPVVQLIFPADTGELMATLKQLADLAWQLNTIMASRPDLYSREQREGLLLQLLASTGDFKRVTEDVIAVARQAIDTAKSQL